MTTTRTAAFALVLMTGTAFAAPAPASRDNALQRFGKSVSASAKYFKADLAKRNEKAGPGIFKRTMANVHEGVASMKAKASALGERISIKVAEKRDAIHASLSAKREAAVAGLKTGKENMQLAALRVAEVGQNAADKTKASFTNAKENIQLAGMRTAEYGKKVVTATKMGVAAAKASHDERVAQRKVEKAANKDFKAWLNEKGNEDAKTFYAGASKEAGLGVTKTLRNLNAAGAVVNAVAATPVNLAIGATNVAAHSMLSKTYVADKRAVSERVVNQYMDKVPAERLELWSKGGVIDPELAK